MSRFSPIGPIPRCLLQRLLQPVERLGRLSLPQVGWAQPLISIEDRLAGGENTFEKLYRLVHSILGIGDPAEKIPRVSVLGVKSQRAFKFNCRRTRLAKLPQSVAEIVADPRLVGC